MSPPLHRPLAKRRPGCEDCRVANESTDVLVIGAGVIGLCAARELSQRGLSVRVIDRERPSGFH